MLKKKIAVFAICTYFSCVMLILGIKMNITALILPIVFTAVFAVETIHAGAHLTAATATANIALALIISKDLFTTYFMVPIIIISGILMGITALKKYNSKLSVLWGILATGGVYGAYIFFCIKFNGTNPVDDMFYMMEEVLKIFSMELETFDLTFVQSYINTCKNMFIAVVIVLFSITGFAVAYITSSVLKLFKDSNQINLSLSRFKADLLTVFIYIATLLSTFFVKEGKLAVVVTDIYLILNFYLTVCGISLVYALLKHKVNVPPAVHKLLGLALCVVSMSSLFSTILVLVGIVDARRDFRKLAEEREGES